ncbi:MAG: ABC transporter ATP-binding protein [Oscillospiraceae bacterium]|jgi:branched-chain amino acid transport system ATP-binding protein|nr:ABC transporter ATP-binding protein [Oscillospiraceae bacterium]
MKLEIKDLRVSYGGIRALKGVNLTVDEGSIVTLIGANGAGKSTTLRAISGLLKPDAGQITYNGESIAGFPAKEIVKRGVVMVPEGRRVFPDMTVRENLLIGAYLRSDRAGIDQDLKYVMELFPRLSERTWQLAGTLSGGEQQMLAVGRALMAKPKLLMMDEPSLGLAPLVVKDIFSIIRRVNQDGITVLLIEQNANASLRVADYGYVLETGSIVLEGQGRALLENHSIQEAYLGHRKSAIPASGKASSEETSGKHGRKYEVSMNSD